MSRIAVDRWQAAQSAEFSHHQDLRLEAYSTASNKSQSILVLIMKQILKIK